MRYNAVADFSGSVLTAARVRIFLLLANIIVAALDMQCMRMTERAALVFFVPIELVYRE